MKVYLNGKVMGEDEALLPAADRGVLFGDGVFETVRAYGGRPFRMDRHLARLREGCRELRMEGPPPDAEVAEAVQELYRLNVGSGDAYIRITLSGGRQGESRGLERPGPPNVHIVVKPFSPFPREWYERGINLIVSAVRANDGSPLSRIKSTNYLDNLMARQEARDRGADDALLLNTRGLLAEATSSNLFMMRGGELATPHVECGLLPGITRAAVMELCEECALRCEAGLFTLADLLRADEAFLSVSTGELVPVREVEGAPIGNACPGPITLRLAAAYRSLVKRELGT